MNKPKARVLLIEDVPIIQTVHMRVLKSLNCAADLAKSGHEALDLYQKNKYDLILLDLGLPDMNGVEICKSIRVKKDILPIVVLTAQGEEFRKECIKAGVTCFVQKPISKETLKEILIQLVPNYYI